MRNYYSKRSTPQAQIMVLVLPALLLLLLFASPAVSAVTVTHLPGFRGALPFHLETGYVSVDEVNGAELFYYFIESERNPSEDPLILWLNGGPGCSAISGLVLEIGPLQFVKAKYDGSLPSLVYKNYSWTKISNIIFVDSPIGTGFSYSRNSKDYLADDTTQSEQIYEFIRKWFVEHPQFLSNQLYVAGESYAGKIAPIVAHKIVKGNKDGHSPFMNLKGYLIGNPFTGELVDQNSQVPYAHGIGIISDELYETIQTNCRGEDYMNPNPVNLLCTMALNKFEMFKSEISEGYTLDPKCPPASPHKKHMVGDRSLQEKHAEILLPPVVPDMKCRSYTKYLCYYWANNYKTREALHIKKGTVEEWIRCNDSLSYTYNVPSTVIYHLNLTKEGYRALVYSGDKDLQVPFIGTQQWIRSLGYSIVDDWRSWHVDGQVAGYTREYINNLTFTTVKDAGHTAPEYMPKNCFIMFDRWISHKPL